MLLLTMLSSQPHPLRGREGPVGPSFRADGRVGVEALQPLFRRADLLVLRADVLDHAGVRQGGHVAQGAALAMRLDKIDSMVYCIMGDGEIQEGQIWEAALSIPMHKLDHVVGIVDWNKGQIDGQVKDVMNIEPIGEKFAAFGWNVIDIDGHDIHAILGALEKAKANAKAKTGKPTMIVADTLKGKGVKFMEEGKNAWHGAATNADQTKAAIEELMKLGSK